MDDSRSRPLGPSEATFCYARSTSWNSIVSQTMGWTHCPIAEGQALLIVRLIEPTFAPNYCSTELPESTRSRLHDAHQASHRLSSPIQSCRHPLRLQQHRTAPPRRTPRSSSHLVRACRAYCHARAGRVTAMVLFRNRWLIMISASHKPLKAPFTRRSSLMIPQQKQACPRAAAVFDSARQTNRAEAACGTLH